MDIRRVGVVLGVSIVTLLGGAERSFAQGEVWDEVAWPRPAPTAGGTRTAWNLGQVAAVAIDAQGRLLVLHRGAHPVLVFDQTGRFLRSWGEGLFSEGKVVGIADAERRPETSGYTAVYGPAGCHACGAHSIRVDRDGRIWVVDAPGHVVYQVNEHGQPVLQLGTKGVSGTGVDTFNLPTDVAVGPDGDVYVSDGYGNARVVKYSADGDYQLEWGRRGNGPGEFGLPHNLVVDETGRVYVTDRDNQRIQVFDRQGAFLEEWTDTGGVSSLFLTRHQQLWAGGVLRSLTGEVLGRVPGGGGGHGTTVSPSGDIYIAQLGGVVQKFVPR